MNAIASLKKLALLALVLTLAAPALSGPALAGPPKVVTSIRPVQALVYAVMGEIGVPDVLLPPGVSPHAFTLKPSQAELLNQADIVFWIGPGLETALEGPLETLAARARVVRLIDAPGLDLIHYAEDAAGHDHEADAEPGHEDHDHGAVDPHVWLSPKNAQALIDAIAAELGALSPGNAGLYAKNAKLAKNRLKLLENKTRDMLSHVQGVPYLVTHDAFAYLARDFGLNEAGRVQLTPGRDPGAKHMAEIRETIKNKGVKCIFSEPQFTSAPVRNLAQETGVRLGELDPLGASLEFSDTLHVRIIQQVSLKLDECLYTPKNGAVDAPAQK